MFVAPLSEISTAATLAGMLGSVCSQDVIDQINLRYGGASTVAFGQVTNPLNTGYQQFQSIVQGQLAQTDRLVQEVTSSVLYPETWRPITSEEALAIPPPSMQVALLMTPPLLELFKNHQVSGWGWDPDTFPDTDQYARSLNNGKVEWTGIKETVPDEVVSEWSTDSTDYDVDEDADYDALVQSRKYVIKRLNQELSENGTRRDVTDLTQTMSI